jgi:hypothetical protein
MATDDECLRYAHEYARLAGLTDYQHVRDQLLDLARGWTAVAQHERRSDDARVLRFTPATTCTHQDALEFPDGQIVLLTYLRVGQRATVLQLPAQPLVRPQSQARVANVA